MIYITTGTKHFLQSKIQATNKQAFLLGENGEDAILLHETNTKSIFQMPKTYLEISKWGTFPNEGVMRMQFFTVREDEIPRVPYTLKDVVNKLNSEKGCLAYRFLQMKEQPNFLLISIWENMAEARHFEHASSYQQIYTLIYQFANQIEAFATKPYEKMYQIEKERL